MFMHFLLLLIWFLFIVIIHAVHFQHWVQHPFQYQYSCWVSSACSIFSKCAIAFVLFKPRPRKLDLRCRLCLFVFQDWVMHCRLLPDTSMRRYIHQRHVALSVFLLWIFKTFIGLYHSYVALLAYSSFMRLSSFSPSCIPASFGFTDVIWLNHFLIKVFVQHFQGT